MTISVTVSCYFQLSDFFQRKGSKGQAEAQRLATMSVTANHKFFAKGKNFASLY
jgi:hypothetical protein